MKRRDEVASSDQLTSIATQLQAATNLRLLLTRSVETLAVTECLKTMLGSNGDETMRRSREQ